MIVDINTKMKPMSILNDLKKEFTIEILGLHDAFELPLH